MRTIILIFCVVLAAASLVVMFRPKPFADWLLDKLATVWMSLLAAAIRIGMGWVLLQAVPISKFPGTFSVLGWIFIVAGVAILLIPPTRLQAMAKDAYERFGAYVMPGGIAGLALAAFLAWAVL